MKITTVADIASLVKQKRKNLKLNQTQLAHRLEMTRQWVASVEKGKETVPAGMLLKLLDTLDIPLITSEQRLSQINTFSRFFAEGVATKIANARGNLKTGEGEARVAAVLFVDLKGFTHLTKSSTPNDILKMLGEYQTIVVKAVAEHDGDIDKFLGDGILISFGAATDHSNFAADALRCSQHISAALQTWQQNRKQNHMLAPEIGIGIAVGEVIFGAVGNEDRMEFTLIGEAVNLAAKLEKHTRKEKADIITTIKTLDLACHQGYEYNENPDIIHQVMLRGMTEPLDLVVLR